jgi:Protein of unknown function (DUF1360)
LQQPTGSATRPGTGTRMSGLVTGNLQVMTQLDDRPLTMPSSPLSWARKQAAAYRNGNDRPLSGYLTLMSTYAGATAVVAGLGRLAGRRPPETVSPWDTALLALATHKVARLVAKDPVTSPLRAPFTSYEGTSAPGELHEEVRGHGLAHSVGELLTCPMCLAQWVATGFSLGLFVAPRPTRMVMATFAAVAGSDFLQHAYVRMQKAG